jgi:hypothetical protein
VADINTAVESLDIDSERQRLEEIYGPVWDTKEVGKEFEILGFLAPFVAAKHRESGKKGTLLFQHQPRFYFDFKPSD